MSNPAASAIRAAWTNWSRTRSMSRRSISRGTWLCGKYGSGEAEMSGQFPSGSGSSIPSHIRRVEPLRPAWASWRAMRAPVRPCTNSTMRFQASTCSGLYIPVQPGLIRPSRLTSVISATMRAAPPAARLPRWTRCQSFGVPSSAEYWHIGDTTMRLERTRSRSRNGVNIGGGGWRRRDRHAALAGRALGEPPVDRRDEARIAHLEVLVGDAKAPREVGHRELDGLEPPVALGRLEPLEADLGRSLEALDLPAPLGLVGGEGRGNVGVTPERPARARWRLPWRASSPSRPRSAPCGPRLRRARRSRATSARCAPSGSCARGTGS